MFNSINDILKSFYTAPTVGKIIEQAEKKQEDFNCCQLKVRIVPSVESESVPLFNKLDQQSRLTVDATARASAATGSSSDGDSDSSIEQRILKPIDGIFKTDKYRIGWEIETASHPVFVNLETDGEIISSYSLLPVKGEIVLSTTKFYEVEDYKNRQKGKLNIRIML